MEETTAFVAQRATRAVPGVLTNFYPTYGDANDQVDRVLPVRRTIFQRVIPRYRLSTSETRDQGLGPAFIHSGYVHEEPKRGERLAGAGAAVTAADPPRGTVAARNPAPAPLWPGTGTKIDLLA
ncbi:MAG: hypothetical protein GVY14_06290 [Spirochaetes bacterium]|nr:hypothetical protein [Spirochaetota bacterium]